MNKQEVFDILKRLFPNNSAEIDLHYAKFSPDEGIKKARERLLLCEENKKTIKNEFLYWTIMVEETIARVMVLIYSDEKFPNLPIPIEQTDVLSLKQKVMLVNNWIRMVK